MRSKAMSALQSDGAFCSLAVCPKCGVHHPAGAEVCGVDRDRSAAASGFPAASMSLGIGAGVLCLVMLYFTAGLTGVVVTVAIVGLCLVA